MGGMGQGCLPGVDPPGVHRKRVFEIEHHVSIAATAAGSVKEASERASGSSDELRVPEAACAAETRRLANQPQEGVSFVSGRGLGA
jgi:hypothetical protein